MVGEVTGGENINIADNRLSSSHHTLPVRTFFLLQSPACAHVVGDDAQMSHNSPLLSLFEDVHDGHRTCFTGHDNLTRKVVTFRSDQKSCLADKIHIALHQDGPSFTRGSCHQSRPPNLPREM